MRKQTKKSLNLANILENGKPQAGDVLISSFLPSTGGQGSEKGALTVRQRGRTLWGRPLCVIIVTKVTESQSKTQFQRGVRTGYS